MPLLAGVGLAAYAIVPEDADPPWVGRWGQGMMLSGVGLLTMWLWYQSTHYYNNFLLGFNDFGHFAQRVANTANGRGVLMETEVLPPFWDHFNPFLLAFVPLWKAIPSIHWFFVAQALCLASGGWWIFRIASQLGMKPSTACLWGGAWLLHPSVSQMNIAYTYGWHPITLALPFLFALVSRWINDGKRNALNPARSFLSILLDFILLVAACSIEESVIVVLSLWFLVRGIRGWFLTRSPSLAHSLLDGSYRPWQSFAVGLGLVGIFVLVYRYSGLAPFQTARFADLGQTPWEIVLSPLRKPDVFWGHVLEYRTWMFLGCLLLPLVPWRMGRGWWCWLPTCLPLGVLIVWNHTPAKSLAFQYPTTLLPFWFLAAMVGSMGCEPSSKCLSTMQQVWSKRSARSALLSAALASMFFGQLPWSCPTIRDVEAHTYDPAGPWTRRSTSEDGSWLLGKVETLRHPDIRALATGRIASHLVGCADIETVGQWMERRPRYEEILGDLKHPLMRYDWILLDRVESFQQNAQQIQTIEHEAKELGFLVHEDRFQIVILKNPNAQTRSN